jgi:glucosylceramidase
MNRLPVPIAAIWLALSVAACGSKPSSTAQQGGSGGSSTGSGGSASGGSGGNANGGSGGSASGGSGGSASGGSAGSASGGSGGSASGGSAGSASGGSGGSASGGSGGSASGGSAGNSSSGTAGSTGGKTGTTGGASGSGGNQTGGTQTQGTGGSAGSTGGKGGATGGTTGSGGNQTGGTQGTGGSAAGGTGGSTNTGPILITSAQNAYWQTGTLTTVTSGNADLTVTDTTTYQTWDGFGGTFNEMGWDALSVVSSEIPNALKLLFDAHDGANFVYGRLPLGASDYAMSWYTLDDTAGDYTMDKFSIERDRQKLIPYIKAALQIKPDLHLWASPWVVPSWMMDSSSNMKSDAQTLGAHALYMARFVEEYAKEGLKIEAIHPQNEPGYAQVHWTQSLFITFIKTYLGPKFVERNLTAEIWCGTMSHPNDGTIATTLANDSAAMKYVKGFGLQWNLQSTVATLAPKGRVWQTEHKCGNYNFATPYWDQSRYDPNKPQNDHLYGEESWQLIRDWIIAGVNSYSAWNMVLDTVGKNLGTGWPQNALLVVDRSAKKLIVTPAYYVFRHFSQYIAPGATRIGTSGSTDAVAFKNPDGSIITEVYNKGTSSKKMTVGVGSALYQFDIPAHGWATLGVTP